MLLSLVTLTARRRPSPPPTRARSTRSSRRRRFPTIIPRLIVFCLLVAIGALAAGLVLDAWRAPARRRVRHGAIWRLLGAPLSNAVVLNRSIAELWNLIRGAAAIAPPRAAGSRAALHRAARREPRPAGIPRAAARRARHGRAARRAVRAPAATEYRQRFFEPGARPADGGRAAEAFDLAGRRARARDRRARGQPLRRRLPPIRTSCGFRRKGRGAARPTALCDRPGALDRLLEEVADRRRRAGHRPVVRAAAGTAARAERGPRATCAAGPPSSCSRSRRPTCATRWSAPPAGSPASSSSARRTTRWARSTSRVSTTSDRIAATRSASSSIAATRTPTTSSSSRSSPPAASASKRSNPDW